MISTTVSNVENSLLIPLQSMSSYDWFAVVFMLILFLGFIFHSESITSRGIFTKQSKPNFYICI